VGAAAWETEAAVAVEEIPEEEMEDPICGIACVKLANERIAACAAKREGRILLNFANIEEITRNRTLSEILCLGRAMCWDFQAVNDCDMQKENESVYKSNNLKCIAHKKVNDITEKNSFKRERMLGFLMEKERPGWCWWRKPVLILDCAPMSCTIFLSASSTTGDNGGKWREYNFYWPGPSGTETCKH
jgi:hypothetical protein